MVTGFGLRLVLSDKLADAVGMDNRFDQDKGIAPVYLFYPPPPGAFFDGAQLTSCHSI